MDDGTHIGGVQHHYMHGLCFDGMWDYQTRSRSGRRSWARLDLGSATYPWAVEDDPEGAGWCVRCCASVLGERPVSLTYMQATPLPRPEPAGVANALHKLLPKFDIDTRYVVDATTLQDVMKVIEAGGGALARLERTHELRKIPPCWVWIVGVEAKPVSFCLSTLQSVGLLLVGRELEPHWASGYGAKAVHNDAGSWLIRSVDGHAWSGRFSSLILSQPR